MLSCILTRLNVRSNHLRRQMKSLLVCSNFFLHWLILIFIPKGIRPPYPPKKKGENTRIISIVSGIPGARAKQTTQINCFSDTKAHSIKANQITSLSSVLLNGLFGTLTTSCGAGSFGLSADTCEHADWKREA